MKINGRTFFPAPTRSFTGIAIGLIVPDLTAGCRFYDIKEFDDSINMEIALSAYISGIPAGIEYVVITGNVGPITEHCNFRRGTLNSVLTIALCSSIYFWQVLTAY